MPTNTYVALDKKTVTGSPVTSVTFTSIPSTYTDLVLVIQATIGAGAAMFYQLNGDTTASNYSSTGMYGDGTTAGSYRTSNNTISGAGTSPNVAILNFQNYSNTATFKTLLSRGNDVGNDTRALVSLWRNTAAINQIVIGISSSSFAVGSTFSLYGIAADTGGSTPKATGGVVTSDSTYWYHTFASVGNFVPNQTLSCDILAIAGGGGGGFAGAGGGGGGAGGLLAFTSQSLTAGSYAAIVGAGGPGGTSGYGSNGADSQFGTLTLVKGGGGGAPSRTTTSENGASGGSGGGGAGGIAGAVGSTGGAATSGQGNAGGSSGNAGGTTSGGGGGGAGAAGASGATTSNGGAGVNTYSSWATATSTGVSGFYAGGGGGSIYPTGFGAGGSGGGGNAAVYDQNSNPAGAGVANTGGGGGAGGYMNNAPAQRIGGNGGSGLVIVRYAK